MKPILLLLPLLLLVGCDRKPTLTTPPAAPLAAPAKPEGKALVSDHEKKDGTVLQRADAIDALAPAAKPHTDAQRAAVAAAPAAQIADMLARYDAFVASANALLAERDKALAKQAERIKALEDAELRAQVRSIRLFGLGCLVVAGLLGYLAKNIPGAAVAGAFGFGALAVAQAWLRVASHPAFIPTVVGVCVAGLVGLAWACLHAYKKGDLAQKTEREAERLRETLKVIVPVLDEAKAQLGDAFKPTLNRLSSGMDYDEKQLVKQIRAHADA